MKVVSPLLVLASVSISSTTHAVDTVEPFNLGLSNAELYLGYEGVGASPPGQRMTVATILGYGVTERVSGYLGFGIGANRWLLEPSSELVMGIYGTSLDTQHVDLILDASASGDALNGFTLRPAFEVNFDADPQMRTWGLFLRGGFPLTGTESESGTPERAFSLTGQAGAYYSIHSGHQVLVAYRMAYHTLVTPGVDHLEIRDVALGYNVMLTDGLELIWDVHLDLPQHQETVSFGAFVGFIATLPTASADCCAAESPGLR